MSIGAPAENPSLVVPEALYVASAGSVAATVIAR
jgi:hypothetical protein